MFVDCVIFGDIVKCVYTAHTTHVLYNDMATTYTGSTCRLGRHMAHDPATLPTQRPAHSG